MPFCHQCGYNLQLGIEKFCPRCGYNLNKGQSSVSSFDISNNKGDVLGAGFAGDNNIIAKDTKGNFFIFNIGSITQEQIKSIITSSTTLDTSLSFKDDKDRNENLDRTTKTKQQTIQVLENIYKIEKDEGRQIQEIRADDLQISKNELSLKELILKGNELFYKNQYNKAIDYYDKALRQDGNNLDLLFNKAYSLDKLGKYNDAIDYYDKALKINPGFVEALNNKGLTLKKLGKYNDAIDYYDKALKINPGFDYALNNKKLAQKS